jgi:hypothetical protein
MNMTNVSDNHKKHNQLHQELEEAERRVVVGGIYSHYKYPENTYKVINLGFIEATDSVCVIYQAVYDQKLVFVRPLDSWLETLSWDGGEVARFKLVK